jgi:hypothetical protein
MEEKVQEFKEYWEKNYGYISMELEDYEIADFISRNNNSIIRACDSASDYLLAQGLAEVDE